MFSKAKILTLALALLTLLTAKAQQAGSSVFDFLEHSNSPVSGALGGKLISNSIALENIYFNPALLDTIKRNQLSLNIQKYLAGITSGEFIYALPRNKLGNLAIGIHYITYGKFDGYDELGNYTGTFTASEKAPYITYSLAIDSILTLGINLKTVFSTLETYKSYGIAADFGILAKINPDLQLALTARNIGKQLKPYYTTTEKLPLNIAAGLTGKFKHAPMRFNITANYLNNWNLRYASPLNAIYLPSNTDTTETINKIGIWADEVLRHLQLGVELELNPSFSLLIGYNYRRAQELSLPVARTSNGLSAGFLLTTKKLDIAYSVERYMRFSVHSFGLNFKLSQFIKRAGK